MKNKYFKLLMASVLMSNLPAIAQVSTYSFSQQAGVYTPLETPEVVAEVLGTSTTERLDTGFYTRELPFTFQFNGVAYNSVHIYTDGYVTFGSWTSPIAHHKPITHSASLHEGVIAVFNDDLEGLDLEGKKGQISFKIVGEAPNREAVIQWKNFTRYSVMGNYTERYELNFQLRLSEGSNVIKKVFDISAVGQPYDRYITSGLRGNSPADFATRKAEGEDVNNWSITTQGTAAADAILTKPNILPSSGYTFIWTPAGVTPTPTPTPTPTDCVAEDQFEFDFENMTAADLFEDYCWNANYTTYPTVSVTNAAGGSGNIALPDNVLQIYKGATTTDDIIMAMPEVSTTNGTHRLSFDIELALSGSPMGITGNEKIIVGTMSDQADFSTFVSTGHEFAVNATGTFTTPAITFPAGHKYVAIRFDFGTQPHKAMVLDNVKWEEAPVVPTPTQCEAVETFDFTFEAMTVGELFEDHCWNGNYTTYPTVSVTNAAGGSGNIALPDNVLQIYKGATTTDDIIMAMPEVSTTNGTHRLSFDIELALSGSPMGITGNEKIIVGTMSDQADFSTFVSTGHEFAVNAIGTFTTPAITFPAGHKYVAMRFDFGTQPHKAMVLDNVKWEESASATIFDNLEVNLYPNPVQSTLNVEGVTDIKTLTVYDINGRFIMESQNTKQIQVDHLSQGVYLLRVSTQSGENTTLKFVKK